MADKYIVNRWDPKTETYKDYVGILISPGFGAGWSTWNDPAILYDEELVRWFVAHEEYGEAMDWDAFEKLVKKKYPETYCGGMRELKLLWVEMHEYFYIDEYDGSESVVTIDSPNFHCFADHNGETVLVPYRCTCCGGHINPKTLVCEYCRTAYHD